MWEAVTFALLLLAMWGAIFAAFTPPFILFATKDWKMFLQSFVVGPMVGIAFMVIGLIPALLGSLFAWATYT